VRLAAGFSDADLSDLEACIAHRRDLSNLYKFVRLEGVHLLQPEDAFRMHHGIFSKLTRLEIVYMCKARVLL
jgi:hypothetical protein